MNVSVVIPTRGDVDMVPIVESFPSEWEVLTYDNGAGVVRTWKGAKWGVVADGLPDLSVYARYACIEYAQHDLVLTQDDDVVVSDPQAIVDMWLAIPNMPTMDTIPPIYPPERDEAVVCNMPQEFRHDGYTDSALVGFGAAFHRDAPRRAFDRLVAYQMYAGKTADTSETDDWFNRTCDVVFTTLTPRVLVDVPKTDCIYASDPNRMWRQGGHIGERDRMIELARQVRDA